MPWCFHSWVHPIPALIEQCQYQTSISCQYCISVSWSQWFMNGLACIESCVVTRFTIPAAKMTLKAVLYLSVLFLICVCSPSPPLTFPFICSLYSETCEFFIMLCKKPWNPQRPMSWFWWCVENKHMRGKGQKWDWSWWMGGRVDKVGAMKLRKVSEMWKRREGGKIRSQGERIKWKQGMNAHGGGACEGRSSH